MSHTLFRVNLDSIVAWILRNSLLKNRCDIWSLSGSNKLWTHNHLVRKWTVNHLATLACLVWLNGWVLAYKLSNCGFEFHCNHSDFFPCSWASKWWSGSIRKVRNTIPFWIMAYFHLVKPNFSYYKIYIFINFDFSQAVKI